MLKLSLLALSVSLVYAASTRSIHKLPSGWRFSHDPLAQESITLTICADTNNVASLGYLLHEISSPDSPKYQDYVQDHNLDLVFQNPSSVINIVDWLEDNLVEEAAVEGKWISFRTSIASANRMFQAQFKWYEKIETKERHLRTMSYTIPYILREDISFVSPTLRFPGSDLRSSQLRVPRDIALYARNTDCAVPDTSSGDLASFRALCNETVFPQCLLDLYNIHYLPQPDAGKIGVAAFMGEYGRYSDLEDFTSTIAPYAAGRNFSFKSINGGGNDQTYLGSSMEANVDLQYTIGIAHPLPVLEYSVGGCNDSVSPDAKNLSLCRLEPWHAFLDGLLSLSTEDLPPTLTLSYGEDESMWPEDEANELCQGFAKLGLRGVSVIVASGDTASGAKCANETLDGVDAHGSDIYLEPNFPATCPYVTVVGSTKHIAPEIAAPFSSGGFSNYFARPSWQEPAVQKYLEGLGTRLDGYFNTSGRAYPDVATQGAHYMIVDKGYTRPVIGTSTSAPTFAAIVALLNAALISSGQKPLGFLNPLLYSNAATGFNDVVDGASHGCPLDEHGNYGTGWPASPGWDAVTGLGTPDFGRLLKAIVPSVENMGGIFGH